MINNPLKDIYLLLNSGMNSKILLVIIIIVCLSTAFEINGKPKVKFIFWQTVGCTAPDCNICPTPDDGTCDKCNDGFYLFNPTTCEDCKTGVDGNISNCALCTYNATVTPALICNTCDNGFFGFTDTQCDACSSNTVRNISNCSLCTYDTINSTLTCDQCDFTYYLDQTNACQSCVTSPQAIAGCADCSYNISTTTVTCNNCDAGFYATNTTQCESCSASAFLQIANCITCTYDAATTTLQCSGCASGFYLSNNGTKCDPCTNIPGCALCTVVDNNGTNLTCTQCQDQYIP